MYSSLSKQSLFGLILGCLLVLSLIPSTWAQYEAEPTQYYLHQKNVNDIQFTEQTTSYLKGTWSYYDQELISQPSRKLPSKTTELPISFQELTGSNTGYGTFVGHFKIPEEFIGRRLAIHIPNQNCAYRVYLNGDFLVRLGDVADNAGAQQTENAPRIAYFVPDGPYFTLSIQASNFNNLRGGLESPMHIGIAKTINRHYQQLMMSIAMICGVVFGVGMFTTMFSMFRGSDERNSKSIFVFGIFILFLALHNLFTAPYAYTTFLDINWLWGIRLEYLFIYLAVMFFLSYMYLLNQHYLQHWIYTISMLVLTLNIVITLLSDQVVFEQLAFYSAFFSIIILLNFAYGFYITLKTKQKYSKLNLYAVVLLCISFIHDFLLTLHVIDSIHLSFISTSLYALLVMFQQSRNYAYQTYHTERLNNNLIELNDSLDQKVQQRTSQLHDLNEKLEYQIQIDALTGAYNRRALNQEIQQRFVETQQDSHATLVFAMMDVDYFKNYNDYYGHLKGDEVLQNLVKVIGAVLPHNAYLARYGGEEFAIVLYNVPLVIISQIMQTVLDAVRSARFEHLNRLDGKDYVTLSMGISWMDRETSYANIHDLMKAADLKLYQAKEAGRDQMKMPNASYETE